MKTASEIILATAEHFQEPRDTWRKKVRAKRLLAIRRIACAVIVRERASEEDAAKELNCTLATITEMATECERAKRYLMHIIDIQKRLRAKDAA